MVVIGYTDPDLTAIPRDSPTPAVRSRFLMYAIAAACKWRLFKGDINTAFLLGPKDEIKRCVFGKPPPELLAKLGVSDNYLVQFQKAVYGFVHARRKSWESFTKKVLALNWV